MKLRKNSMSQDLYVCKTKVLNKIVESEKESSRFQRFLRFFKKKTKNKLIQFRKNHRLHNNDFAILHNFSEKSSIFKSASLTAVCNTAGGTDLPLLNGGVENSLPLDFKVSNCNIDLDTYSLQYQDLYKVHRLLFIAEHCPVLKTDALILALKHIEVSL